MRVQRPATTAMTVPIASGVAGQFARAERAIDANVGVAITLGTAHAAGVGDRGRFVGSLANGLGATDATRWLADRTRGAAR